MKIYVDAGGRLRVNNKYFNLSTITVGTNDLGTEIRLYELSDDVPFLTLPLTSVYKSDGVTAYSSFAEFINIVTPADKTVTIDYIHDKIHKGWVFYRNEVLTINSGTSQYIEFITPAANLGEIHFGYEILGTGILTFEMFSGSTRELTVSGKRTLTNFNRKEASNNVSSVTGSANATIQAGVGADGLLVRQVTAGYSSGQTRISIPIGTNLEYVMKPSTKYMIKITSGTAQTVSYRLDWYNDFD